MPHIAPAKGTTNAKIAETQRKIGQLQGEIEDLKRNVKQEQILRDLENQKRDLERQRDDLLDPSRVTRREEARRKAIADQKEKKAKRHLPETCHSRYG